MKLPHIFSQSGNRLSADTVMRKILCCFLNQGFPPLRGTISI